MGGWERKPCTYGGAGLIRRNRARYLPLAGGALPYGHRPSTPPPLPTVIVPSRICLMRQPPPASHSNHCTTLMSTCTLRTCNTCNNDLRPLTSPPSSTPLLTSTATDSSHSCPPSRCRSTPARPLPIRLPPPPLLLLSPRSNRFIALMSAITLREHPGSTIVTDSVTSNGLTDFITKLGGKHLR